jgi:hypothetical protein
MVKLSQQILAQIQKQEVTPRPRWQFILRSVLLWGGVALLLLAAGFITGVLLQLLFTADWEIAGQYPGGRSGFLLRTLSATWLLLFLAGIAGAYFLFRQTPRGYRLASAGLLALLLLVALVVGSAALPTEIPERLQAFHEARLGQLEQRIFDQVEHGVLEGRIIAVDLAELQLRDRAQKDWQVALDTVELEPRFELAVGLPVRIFGQQTGQQTFRADRLRPLRPGMLRGGMMGPGGSRP